jgi:hypothetical protein
MLPLAWSYPLNTYVQPSAVQAPASVSRATMITFVMRIERTIVSGGRHALQCGHMVCGYCIIIGVLAVGWNSYTLEFGLKIVAVAQLSGTVSAMAVAPASSSGLKPPMDSSASIVRVT